MTFTMPYYMEPLLDFYSLKWPDIDEDQVREVGEQVKELADAAHEFADSLERALGALAGDAESDALRAMHSFWADFTSGPVLKVTDDFGNGAKTACDVTSEGVLLYKEGVALALFVNCVSDIALIVSGVGVPLAVAKKAAMRAVMEIALEQLAAQFADYLLGQFNKFLDDHVFSHIEDLGKQIRDDVVSRASSVIAMSLPVHSGSVALAALYIDHDDVVNAATDLHKSYERLHGAIHDVAGWIKSKDLAAPNPAAPDSTVRTVLTEAVDWAADQLVKLLEDIATETVNKIIDTITGIYDKYVEADQSLGAMAQDLRDKFKFPPPVAPFQIDRSTQPKPVYILDAPPKVVTGEGVSDARNGIVVINLPEPPDPVVTGLGESDARLDIRQILLPTAPEPVRTGPGTSHASDNIEEIVLPSAGQQE